MKMPRSTYYYKVKKKEEEGEKELVAMIEAIVVEFPRYGYRRVTKELHRRNRSVNHKVVLKLMRQHGLLCKRKRSFVVHTTDSHHVYQIYPNLIKDIVATGINQIWVSDITYIRILMGFVYLAVILDAFSRKAVGYAVSRSLDRTLTMAALNMAIESRNPPPGCIHHSDRGVQYAAEEYVDILKASKFRISMSNKGNPYDNAMAESFIKTLKHEEVYLADYQTYTDVVENIPSFLRDVYNAKRLHSSLGYLPPDEFESLWLEKNPAVVCSVLAAPPGTSVTPRGNSPSIGN